MNAIYHDWVQLYIFSRNHLGVIDFCSCLSRDEVIDELECSIGLGDGDHVAGTLEVYYIKVNA